MSSIDADVVARNVEMLKLRLQSAGASDLKIVAVTKTFGPDAISAAVSAGLDDIGEKLRTRVRGEALRDGGHAECAFHRQFAAKQSEKARSNCRRVAKHRPNRDRR